MLKYRSSPAMTAILKSIVIPSEARDPGFRLGAADAIESAKTRIPRFARDDRLEGIKTHQ